MYSTNKGYLYCFNLNQFYLNLLLLKNMFKNVMQKMIFIETDEIPKSDIDEMIKIPIFCQNHHFGERQFRNLIKIFIFGYASSGF